jgi:hypothetical protein
LKLDFAAQKKGGMAVSAVWRRACLLALAHRETGGFLLDPAFGANSGTLAMFFV